MTTLRLMSLMLAVVFAIPAGPAQAAMKKEWLEYTHGATKLKGYLVYDDANRAFPEKCPPRT